MTATVIRLFGRSRCADLVADFTPAQIAWIFSDDPELAARLIDLAKRADRLTRIFEEECAIRDGTACRVRHLRLVAGDIQESPHNSGNAS